MIPLDRHVAGMVLTGGLSSRMGTDKSSLIVDGQPMADRSLNALRNAGLTLLYSAGPERSNPYEESRDNAASDVTVLPDRFSSEGPLSGIVTVWTHLCETRPSIEAVAVLSCDLPRVESGLVTNLLQSISADPGTEPYDAALAHDGQTLQPLVAVYRRPALDEMLAGWHQGERSIRRLLKRWSVVAVAARGQATDADEPVDLSAHDVVWPQGHKDRTPN